VQRVVRDFPRVPIGDVAKCYYECGRCHWKHRGLFALSTRILRLSGLSDPSICAQITWGCARTAVRDKALFEGLASRFSITSLGKASSETITRLLWAFSTNNIRSDELYKKCAKVILVTNKNMFNSRELATCMWAFSKINKEPEVVSHLAEELVAQLQGDPDFVSPQAIATALFALHRRAEVTSETIDLCAALGTKVLTNPEEFNAEEFAKAIYVLGLRGCISTMPQNVLERAEEIALEPVIQQDSQPWRTKASRGRNFSMPRRDERMALHPAVLLYNGFLGVGCKIPSNLALAFSNEEERFREFLKHSHTEEASMLPTHFGPLGTLEVLRSLGVQVEADTEYFESSHSASQKNIWCRLQYTLKAGGITLKETGRNVFAGASFADVLPFLTLTQGHRRGLHAEACALSKVHHLLRDIGGGVDSASVTGSLKLSISKEPCTSCIYVISQFMEMYPLLNLTVSSPRRLDQMVSTE